MSYKDQRLPWKKAIHFINHLGNGPSSETDNQNWRGVRKVRYKTLVLSTWSRYLRRTVWCWVQMAFSIWKQATWRHARCLVWYPWLPVPALLGNAKKMCHFTKLAVACQMLLITFSALMPKFSRFKNWWGKKKKMESYLEGTCGIHIAYLAGLSSSWPETQIPSKRWMALSPNLGTTQPPMCPPPDRSFATPPAAGPEWGRPAWPRCTEMLKGEKKNASRLPDSSSKCTNHTGVYSLPKS